MATETITKTCRVCKETKALSEFYEDVTYKDGHKSKCKMCYLQQLKRYSRTNRGKATIKCYAQSSEGKAAHRKASARYDKSEKGKAIHRKAKKRYRQTEKGKATEKRYQQTEEYIDYRKRYNQSEQGRAVQIVGQRRFQARHPEQCKAIQVVRDAIRIGKLPRPDTLQCHYCPAQAEQYHHHKGYAPEHRLNVIPVCILCHGKTRIKAS